MRDYIERVGRSAAAFNNTAVYGCLGWKLGEYLALGEAIISLPLSRALPAPLEHSVHLHVVDGSPASIDDALERPRRDDVYRRKLETRRAAMVRREPGTGKARATAAAIGRLVD